nr:AI-2E family transporter [Acidobacteriota bacterium]
MTSGPIHRPLLGPQHRRAAAPIEAATEPRPQLRWSTILKILLALLILWAAYQLWSLVLAFVFSLLLAIAATPLIAWAERRGLSNGVAVILFGAVSLSIALLCILFVAPPLAEQIQTLLRDLPAFSRRVVGRVRPSSPFLAGVLGQVFELPTSPEFATWLKKPLVWGQAAVELGAAGVFTFMLTLYLLFHGKRSYVWLLAYVPRSHRRKMADTIPEVSDVVLAYTRGQILTTLFFSCFAFMVLTAFHVPAALPLAILAGFCDVIPIVGIVIATTPAVILALTVSQVAAGAVLVLYILYAGFEAYILVPRLYGRHLRLSPLVVLLALAIGGRLQGIAGALLILPFVAAYPIVERIWLPDYLGEHVIDDHSALE